MTSISHYTITRELGRGGMGVVYLARDTKLNRDVAIKVLPSAALATEDDRARFYREAQSAAQLHHPHIATIFGIDEAVPGDAPADALPSPFIAMEYIEGETLEARIRQGPLKLDEALRIAIEVTDALGLAHEKEIVHRDVKSANVMLGSRGSVLGAAKVLDFGLAKTSQSTKLTQLGSTLGTVAYMSPEQARGEEVDRRADLWAVGVILYEMISGRLPFGGGYQQAVVYAILNEDPEPLTSIRTGVPMELENVVAKCLRKDRRHRYQTAGGLIADLESIRSRLPQLSRSHAAVPSVSAAAAGPTGGVAGVGSTDGPPAGPTATRVSNDGRRSRVRRAGLIGGGIALGLVAGLLLSGLLGWSRTANLSGGVGGVADVIRTTIPLPDRQMLLVPDITYGVESPSLDLSRDGRNLVFVAVNRDDEGVLAVRSNADGSIRILSGTEGAAVPGFSPDGASIAYATRAGLFIVPTGGGRPRFVTNTSDTRGLVWHRDGTIYFTDRQGSDLIRVRPDGTREALTTTCRCGLPTEGPGGVGVVVSGRDQEFVQWFRSGEEPVVIDVPGFNPQYLTNGFVTFTRTGAIYAARYDRETGGIVGPERLLFDDVRTGTIVRAAHYAVSDNGTLVYVAGQPSGLVEMVIREADGSEMEVGLPVGVYGPVDVSVDERWVLVVAHDRRSQYVLFDRETGVDRPLTSIGTYSGARLMPDGQSVIHAAWTDDATEFSVRDVRTDRERTLFEHDETGYFVDGVSPDGKYLAYRRRNVESLYIRNLQDNTDWTVDSRPGEVVWVADWSRDGRLFTYTKVDDRGSWVYVEPVPPNGSSWLVSSSDGEEGEFLPDRNALVFRAGFQWLEVTYEFVDGAPPDRAVRFSQPRVLFEGPYVNIAGMEYRMLRGGRALLQRAVNVEYTAGEIQVVTGLLGMMGE